jgi:energy-coupling factor transporter ATP-binding protein EcfA2
MITFDNVSMRYADGREALSEINFEIGRGEIAFVAGHSGAGKSTPLKLILAIALSTLPILIPQTMTRIAFTIRVNLLSILPIQLPAQLIRHNGCVLVSISVISMGFKMRRLHWMDSTTPQLQVLRDIMSAFFLVTLKAMMSAQQPTV